MSTQDRDHAWTMSGSGSSLVAGIGKTSAGRRAPGVLYRAFAKRLLDISLVLLVLPIILPTVVVLATLVALDGGQPFYTQNRIGRGGRLFRMWKLRSMVTDADARLEEHLRNNPTARAEWDETQKLKSDPRITRIGHILRKCSLDELPQLWNVLKGDMSLVGPRPMMPSQAAMYPGTAYFALRPGVTGPWQVSERNESSFAARASYDSAYLNGLSFTLDVKIMVATVRVILRATGY
ncbi:sugar transferase [Rubellimicrobium arenae]|uniref:sugar transferase n=1 Tax=Rubellimicrobium arenae TaxID=2817372 RepID=UPI001FF005BD|nr:sugar transferase [Rubellimicrobium arenae]